MSDLGRGMLISLVLSWLIVGPIETSYAAELSQELQDLTRIVSMACPKRWENIPEYLAHKDNHDVGRLYYSQQMADDDVDIWAGDAIDRMNYIKYARFFLVGENGEALDTYTHPASVAYQCYEKRNELLVQLNLEIYAYSGAYNRFGEFKDADKDTVMNAFDLCPNTPIGEIVPPKGQPFAGCSATQRDSDNDGVNDALDQCPNTPEGEIADGDEPWVGCSATERDTDGDGVNDAYDECANSTDPASANEEGCDKFQIDSDDDGIPDFMDSYPHQGEEGAQCYP